MACFCDIIKGALWRTLFCLLVLCLPQAVMAQETPDVYIPQVSKDPVSEEQVGQSEGQKILETLILQGLSQKQDYQQQVINDPRYTNYGRAQAVKEGRATQIPEGKQEDEAEGDAEEVPESQAEEAAPVIGDNEQDQVLMGGNSAHIIQEGPQNISIVSQSGTINRATHFQSGEHNSVFIDQLGEDNVATETQVGGKSVTIKIQRKPQ